MARSQLSVSAVSPAKLMTAVNTALLPYTQHTIAGVVFVVGDNATYSGEYKIVITLEDGAGPAIDPFEIQVFDAPSWSVSVDALSSYITANPTQFISTPFAGYLVGETGRFQRNPVLVFVNDDSAAAARFIAGGGAPSGAAGGDLSGTYPSPTVVGIRGVSIPAGPVSGGSTLTFNSDTGDLVWYAVLVYPDLLAAAADQVNQFVGATVIIYNPPGTPDDGTYRVNAITGSPADYTKISDATETASEVSIVDAGGYYTSTDVEGALQEIGAELDAGVAPTGPAGGDLGGNYPNPSVEGIQGEDIDNTAQRDGDMLVYNQAGPAKTWIPGPWISTTPLTGGVATQFDSLPVDVYGAATWEVVLENTVTGEREVWTVWASHNGTTSADATDVSFTVAGLDPDILTTATFSATLTGAGIAQTFNMLVTVTGANWRAVARRTPLNAL